MTTAPSTLASSSMVKAGGRWFYVGMAVFAILFSIAAFGPSLMQTSGRPGPLTGLPAAHGAVFFARLLVFLAQSILARTGRLALHRQLGMWSAILAAAMSNLSAALNSLSSSAIMDFYVQLQIGRAHV